MEFRLLVGGLVSAVPALAVWIVALVLSSVLMKKGGGRIERFLLIGSILMLVSTLLSVPQPAIAHYLAQSSLSNAGAAGVVSGINLFLGLISLAGVICLFYAIWRKFSKKPGMAANNQQKEYI